MDKLLRILGHGEAAVWFVAYNHFLKMLFTFVWHHLLWDKSFDQILWQYKGPHLKRCVEYKFIPIDIFPVNICRDEVINEVLVKLLRHKLQHLEWEKDVLEPHILIVNYRPIQIPQKHVKFGWIVLAYIPEEILENALIPGTRGLIFFYKDLLFDIGFEFLSVDVHLQFRALLQVWYVRPGNHLL